MRKFWITATVLLCMALSSLCLFACGNDEKTSDSPAYNEVVLAGFETADELRAMTLTALSGKVEFSDEHVTQGKKSAKFILEGRHADNAFYIATGNAFVPKTDYSDVIRYAIDVYNDTQKSYAFALGYNDLGFNKDFYLFGYRTIKPGENHIVFDIDNGIVKSLMKTDAVTHFSFFIEGREDETEKQVFYLDNFRAYTKERSVQTHEKQPNIDFSRRIDFSQFCDYWFNTAKPSSKLRRPRLEENTDMRYVLSGKTSAKITFGKRYGSDEPDINGFRTRDGLYDGTMIDGYDADDTYFAYDLYNDSDKEITVRFAAHSNADEYFGVNAVVAPHTWARSGNRMLLRDIDNAWRGDGLADFRAVSLTVIDGLTPDTVVYLDNISLLNSDGTSAQPKERLAAPELTVSDKTVSWTAVEKATGYAVKVNDGEWSEAQTETRYVLSETTAGIYTVSVKAVDAQNTLRESKAASATIAVNEKLLAPAELRADGNTVSWSAVAHASGYCIKVGDGAWSEAQTGTSYMLVGVETGTHTVYVKAVSSDDLYTESDAAQISVSVEYQLVAPTLTLDDKTVSWTAVEKATGYAVKVNDGEWSSAQTETSYTLAETAAGKYTVSVKAVSSSSEVKDSTESSVTITVTQKLTAPVLTENDGAIRWNAVENASGYRIKIGNGNWGAMQTATSYTLTDLPASTYTVYVKAVSTDEWYLESDAANVSVTVADIIAPVITKKNGKTDHFVAAGTNVALASSGIAGYLSATEETTTATFTYDKVLRNGVERTGVSQFTIAKNEVWEVFVTVKDEANNESYGYIQFVADNLKDGFISFNDGVWVFGFTWPGNDAGAGQRTIYKLGEGTKYVNILMVNDDTSTLITDKYGKVTLKANFTSVYEIGLLASMNSVRMSMKLSAQTTVPCVFDGICSTQFGYDGNWYVWKNDGIYNGSNEKIGGTDFFEIYAATLTDRSDGYRYQAFGTGANGVLSNFTLEIDHIAFLTSGAEKLSTPELTVNGKAVSWNAVENAAGYRVQLGDGEWSALQTGTSFTLTESAGGVYTVKVKAVPKEQYYRESDAAQISVTITEQLATPVLTVDANTVRWEAVTHADGYMIKVDDGEWTKQTACEYTFTANAGSHTLIVKAVSDSEIYTESEEASQTVQVTLALATPELTLSDKTVTWNAVANATGYMVKVNDGEWSEAQIGTSYTLAETTAGKYTVSVKAVDSSGNYNDSAAAQKDIEVIVTLSTPVLTQENAVVSWNAIEHATGYQVKIDGGDWGDTQTELSYDCKGLPTGSVTVYVKAITMQSYYAESQEAQISVNVPDTLRPVVTKKDGKTDQFVAVGTQITLGDSGLGDYLTVTDDSNSFTLTYDKVLKNGIAQTGTMQFTVNKNDVWEVFVTAKDGANNEQKSYMQFVDEGLKSGFVSFNDCEWDLVYANNNQLFFSPKGGTWANGVADMYNVSAQELVTDEYGKKYVRFTYCANYEFSVHPVGGSLPQVRLSIRLQNEASLSFANMPNPSWKADGLYDVAGNKLGEKGDFFEFFASGLTDRGDGLCTARFTPASGVTSLTAEIDRFIYAQDFGEPTFVNYVVVNKKDGKTDQFVAENTQVTLGNGGITAQDTAYLSAIGNVTYTYDKVLRNGVAQTDTTQFTVAKNDVWEVFVTLNKGTDKESYTYMQFVDSGLQDGFISFNDGLYVLGWEWPGNDAGAGQRTIYKSGSGDHFVNFLTVDDTASKLVTDKYGKVTLQVKFVSAYEFKLGVDLCNTQIRLSMKMGGTGDTCRWLGVGPVYYWKADGVYSGDGNGANTKIGERDTFLEYQLQGLTTDTANAASYHNTLLQDCDGNTSAFPTDFILEIDRIIYGNSVISA